MNFEELNKTIATEYSVAVEDIKPENNIRQTLKLDSMRAMTLILIVKQQTGVMISPRHLPGITTFQSLYDYIEAKM